MPELVRKGIQLPAGLVSIGACASLISATPQAQATPRTLAKSAGQSISGAPAPPVKQPASGTAAAPLAAARADSKSSPDRRVLNFPKNFSIGKLYMANIAANPGNDDQKAVTAAYGTVTITVPQNAWLVFEPNGKGYLYPQLLDLVDPKGIDAIFASFFYLDESEAGFTEHFLLHCNHFTNLKALVLDHSDVSDKVIDELKAQPDLVIFSANLCSLTGECLRDSSRFPNITTLNLTFAPLTTQSLSYIASYKRLTLLDVRQAHIDDAGLKRICNSPSLVILKLGGNPKITDAGLKYLPNLQHLTDLDITETAITSKSLKLLCSLKLKHLGISSGTFNEQELKALRQACGQLNIRLSSQPVDKTFRELFAPLH